MRCVPFLLACLPLTALAAPALASGDLPAVTVLVLEGDAVAGVGNVTSTSAVAIASDGSWAVEVDTDHPDTTVDGVLIGPGGPIFREGQALAAPAGSALGSFGPITGSRNEAGHYLWNLFLDGTSGSGDDSGLFYDDQLLIQEGEVLTFAGLGAGTTLRGLFTAHHNDANQALVMASVDDPGIASTVDRALLLIDLSAGGALLGGTTVALEGDVLPGQTEPLDDMETSLHNFALNDAGDVMFIADLAGDTAVDHVVYLNDAVLAQEGGASPVAGRNWDLLSLAELSLADNGSWALQGSLEGDTSDDDILVVDGAVVAREGGTLPAIHPFQITSLGTTGASGPVFLGENGNLLWSARWNGPAGQDKGLFVNDRLIAQIGVTQAAGATLAEIFAVTEGYALSEDGQTVVFRGRLDDGRDGVFRIDVGPWVSLGQGLAGTGGVTPCVVGAGPFTAGSVAFLTLSDALPNSTTNLVVGFSELGASFKGGVLVPDADLLFPGLPTDPAGVFALTTTVPAGVPSGVDLWFQYWTADGAAPVGFSASNGLRLTTP